MPMSQDVDNQLESTLSMVEDEACPLLDVQNVTMQYKTKEQHITATYKVDFQVYPAERFILLGPSGCGKSTMLKGVGGFIRPSGGTIKLKGKEVDQPGPDRMMVFQEFDQLLPWKKVIDNIAFPMISSKRYKRKEAIEKAEIYLDKVGLTKFRNVYPHTLSGGMKQRVAIARAMALSPDVMLMDEPFASLDALTRLQMQEELLRLWSELRFTVLFVTHSIQEAIILGTRILVMSSHPGQVRAELNVHEFSHENQASSGFKEMQQNIHDMLFSEQPDEKKDALNHG